jgi:hypothetical protein
VIDQQFFQWAISQTGLAGVLVIVIWLWQRDRRESDRRNDEREERMIQIVERQERMTDTLITVVRTNAETFTRLTSAIEGLEKVVANCGIAQRVVAVNPDLRVRT